VRKLRFLFTDTNPMITYGLGRTLAEMGEEVKIIDAGALYRQDPALLDQAIATFSPDFVCSQGGWGGLGNMIFPILAQRGIPHVFWASEDPIFISDLSLPMALKSRFVFTTAEECIPQYQARGIKAHLMMFACTPSFHHQVEPDPRFHHDLIFIGNNYSQFPVRLRGMQTILKPIIDHGFDLKIYGLDWWLNRDSAFYIEPALYGGGLSNEEMRQAYSSAKIVLGLHSVDTSSTMMSMRTFEVLGCGAFYLTQWTPAIERHFRNHEHLVWSKSAAETLDLVNHYLANPEERLRIARNGQAEVYAKHTYHHRTQEFLRVIRSSANYMPKPGTRFYYSVGESASQNWSPMQVKKHIIRPVSAKTL